MRNIIAFLSVSTCVLAFGAFLSSAQGGPVNEQERAAAQVDYDRAHARAQTRRFYTNRGAGGPLDQDLQRAVLDISDQERRENAVDTLSALEKYSYETANRLCKALGAIKNLSSLEEQKTLFAKASALTEKLFEGSAGSDTEAGRPEGTKASFNCLLIEDLAKLPTGNLADFTDRIQKLIIPQMHVRSYAVIKMIAARAAADLDDSQVLMDQVALFLTPDVVKDATHLEITDALLAVPKEQRAELVTTLSQADLARMDGKQIADRIKLQAQALALPQG